MSDRWSQLRLGNILLGFALCGAMMATGRWAASTNVPFGLGCLLCLPFGVATVLALFGRPALGVALAILSIAAACLVGMLFAGL